MFMLILSGMCVFAHVLVCLFFCSYDFDKQLFLNLHPFRPAKKWGGTDMVEGAGLKL